MDFDYYFALIKFKSIISIHKFQKKKNPIILSVAFKNWAFITQNQSHYLPSKGRGWDLVTLWPGFYGILIAFGFL